MTRINLSELTLDNFWQWPIGLRYCALILSQILLGCLSYSFILKPYLIQYEDLVDQEMSLRMVFEEKQQRANINPYRQALQRLRQDYERMLKQLATQAEISTLLEDISKTGSNLGLSFELFAPTSEKIHDFYVELALNMVVLGDYQQFALFISQITQFRQLVSLQNFEILQAHSEVYTEKDNLLRMKLTAKIYRSKG